MVEECTQSDCELRSHRHTISTLIRPGKPYGLDCILKVNKNCRSVLRVRSVDLGLRAEPTESILMIGEEGPVGLQLAGDRRPVAFRLEQREERQEHWSHDAVLEQRFGIVRSVVHVAKVRCRLTEDGGRRSGCLACESIIESILYSIDNAQLCRVEIPPKPVKEALELARRVPHANELVNQRVELIVRRKLGNPIPLDPCRMDTLEEPSDGPADTPIGEFLLSELIEIIVKNNTVLVLLKKVLEGWQIGLFSQSQGTRSVALCRS